VRTARERLLDAALADLTLGSSPAVDLARKNFKMRLGSAAHSEGAPGTFGSGYEAAFRQGLQSARRTLLAMRDRGDIGDDAFHALENDLDWMEVSDPLRAANADDTPA
jgi:CPA1 family monovalent cation:H+ antiporter